MVAPLVLLLLLGAVLQNAAGQTASCSLSVGPASPGPDGSAAAAPYAARVDCQGSQAPLLVARPEVVVQATFNGSAATVTTNAGQADDATALLSVSFNSAAAGSGTLHLVLTGLNVSNLGNATSPLPYSVLSVSSLDVLDISNSTFSSVEALYGVLLVQPGVDRRPLQVRVRGSKFTRITTNATLVPATGALTFAAPAGSASYHSIEVSDSSFTSIISKAYGSFGAAVSVRGCNTDARFVFQRVAFASNIAAFNTELGRGGALFVGPGCSGTFDTCTFFNNTAPTSGGAVRLTNTVSVGINDCVFDSNRVLGRPAGNTGGGGAVFALNVSEVSMHNVTVSNNRIKGSGAGVMISQLQEPPLTGTRLWVSDCSFLNNQISSPSAWGLRFFGGGGISVNGPAVLELNSVNFSGNAVSADYNNAWGGAVLAAGTNVTANNCTFTNNSALMGGALSLSQQSKAVLTACTFSANRVNDFTGAPGGGAMHVVESAINMRKVMFTTNVATGMMSRGGAMLIMYSNASMVGCDFLNNSIQEGPSGSNADVWALQGGAILILRSLVSMSECRLEGNAAPNNGAGGAICITRPDRDPAASLTRGWPIFNDKSSALIISHSTFISNTASLEGGAIRAERLPLLQLYNVTIDANSAASGGAVHLTQSNATFDNCTFRGNNATLRNGAALFATTSSATDVGFFDVPSRTHLSGCLIEYNSAIATSATGALQIHSQITTAQAGDSRPLPYQIKHSAWLQNCTFRLNSARGGGAAIAASGPGTDVMIVASRFLNNSALGVGPTSGGRGGALQLQSCFSVTLSGCEVSGNLANMVGGISADNVRFLSLISTRLFANRVTHAGDMAGDPVGTGFNAGAVDILPVDERRLPPSQAYDWPGPSSPPPLPPADRALRDTSSAPTSDPTVDQGSVGSDGDAASLSPGRSDPMVHIRDSFLANSAGVGGVAVGGGINLRDWPWLVVERSTIAQNNAQAGAAINVTSTSKTAMYVVVRETNFTSNTATSELEVAQGMGGAAVSIIGVGTKQCFVALHDSLFQNNTATNGGAVFAQGPNIVLDVAGCFFHGNVARSSDNVSGSGGSLSVAGISQFNLRDSKVTGSRAGSGGGVYVLDVPNVLVTRCFIAFNTALSSSEGATGGGMIWSSGVMLPRMFQANISVQNTTFESNTAAFSYAGGLAIQHAPMAWQISVHVLGSAFRHNRAGIGAGLYQAAPQSTLVISDTDMFNNTAATAMTAPGSGGSGGGGLAVDAAATLFLNNTSIRGCAAARGAGIFVTSVTQVWIVNCTVADNAAIGSLPYAMPPSLDTLPGTGAGMWLSGDGSHYLVINGSTFRNNYAGLLGGGMALLGPACESPQPSAAAPPQPLAPADVSLATLALLRATNMPCLPPIITNSIVRDNVAGDSGGGIFSPFAFRLTNCSDLGSTADQPPVASAAFPNVCGDLNNTALRGFGPTLATSPVSMVVAKVATQQTGGGVNSDPWESFNSALFLSASSAPSPLVAANGTSSSPDTSPSIPSYQSLVFPSSLASNRELLQLAVWDRVNQSMAGPWFGLMYVVNVNRSSSPYPGSTAGTTSTLGQNLVVYKDTPNARAFLIDASILIVYGGRIDDRRTLTFALQPVVGHGSSEMQVLASSLDILIPPCMNGEAIRYLGANITCERCIAGTYKFTKPSSTATAPASVTGGAKSLSAAEAGCSVCPEDALCPGGPVIVPASGYWHSHPQSTSIVQCLYGPACERSDDWVLRLTQCKETWFTQLHRDIYIGNGSPLGAGPLPESCVALGLKKAENVSLLSTLSENKTYSDLLCTDGYGGNLCGVCVPTRAGAKTGMQGNFQCSTCSETWQTVVISVALFLANLLMVAIQVMGTMGEQLQSCNLRSLEASDLISLLITHLQCLVVIFKLNMQWPPVVVGLSKFAVTFASISEQYTRATSISCLSDGSPEAQATYVMAWGLASPAVLIVISVLAWCLFWLFRHRHWYKAKGSNSLSSAPSKPSAAALSRSPQIVQGATSVAALPGAAHSIDGEAPGKMPPTTFGQLQGLPASSKAQISMGDGTLNQILTQHASIEEVEVRITVPEPGPMPLHCVVTSCGTPGIAEGTDGAGVTSDTLNTTQSTQSTDHPGKAPDKASGKVLKSGKLSISSVGSLRRRMPSMEDVREPTTWLNKAREGDEEQEDESLHMGLMENMALLDTFMTLKQQLAVVMLCAYFVVYQAWSSAALNVFSCYFIDSGSVSTSYPSFYAYFQAAAAKNGYWKLNLNQACYEGQHLSVWTPVGVVCSVLVAFGLPVMQFLPVYLNRKRLQEPAVRFRFGRLYLSYFYNRVPYWGAARQLQMLVLIVVQAFSDGLKSPVQQATMLLNTLVLFQIINLAVWPMVSPMLMLMDFLSAAVLIATLSLGIPFSDTNNTIGEGYANTCGALILIVNSLYLIVLVFLCGRAFMTTSGRKLKTLGGAIKKAVSKIHHKSKLRLTKKGSQGCLPKSSSGRSGQVRQASLGQLPTTVPEDSVCD